MEFLLCRRFDSTRGLDYLALEQLLLGVFHWKWFANQGTKFWIFIRTLRVFGSSQAASPVSISSKLKSWTKICNINLLKVLSKDPKGDVVINEYLKKIPLKNYTMIFVVLESLFKTISIVNPPPWISFE